MRLLILGGTIFLGRHLVEAAVLRGDQVSLFNRGRHYPENFPDVERIVGDRWGDLSGLRNRSWDAVIDTSGHVPQVVQRSAELLSGSVGHYTFLSTVFVYKDFPRLAGLTETSPVTNAADPAAQKITPQTLGPLKALCEQALLEAFGDRLLVVRAGFIFGPHDPTQRSAFWIDRLAHGGEVLAPGDPGRQLQLVDVRDLAEWILCSIEAGRAGPYNVTGPGYPSPLTFEHFLQTCSSEVGAHSSAGAEAQLTWVTDELLRSAGIRPGIDLPFWMPGGVAGVDCNKAIAAGLTFRPFEETVRYTLAWYNSAQPCTPPRAGLARDHEEQLLRAWHKQSGEPVPRSKESKS